MLITNFSSGELSPQLQGRVDLAQYYQAAGHLSNFEIIPTGGIRRRTGTRRLGALPAESWLVPFNIDKDLSFLFVCHEAVVYAEADPQPTSETFGQGTYYIEDGSGGYEPATVYDEAETYYTASQVTTADVWRNGAPETGPGGAQVTIPLPFLALSEIKESQYAQYYDTLILCHRDYKPYRIKYDAALEAFAAGAMDFSFAPSVRLDDDYDYIIEAENALPAVDVEGGIPYVGGKAYPDGLYALYSGQLWEYHVIIPAPAPPNPPGEWRLHQDGEPAEENLFNAYGKYPGCVTFFNNRLYFAAARFYPQKVWASRAPDTKDERYSDFSTYETYVTVNKIIRDPDLHVFTGSVTSGATTITGVSQDFTSALAEDASKYYVTADCFPVGTKVVSVTSNSITVDRAAISDATSLVMNISLWKNSLSPSAEDYRFQVIVRSIVTADCSFNFEIASEANDAIKWISNNRMLVIGTETSVWVCSAAISAVSVAASLSCRYGSDGVQALSIDTATVFFAQGRYGIREFYYDSATGAFQTNNLAILSERMLTESPAVDFDYAQNPACRLFVVRADGKCVTLLYDKTNGVMGWSRIAHGTGSFVSCAVTRGDRQNDIAYFVVKDGTAFYLERIDGNDGVYLDSFEEYDASSPGSVTGRKLWNRTTGAVCDADNVPAGFISEGDEVFKGYAFESRVTSLPVIRDDSVAIRRITELSVRFLESALPVMTVADQSPETFVNFQAPYTGVARVQFPGSYDRDVVFELVTDSVIPCVVLGVDARLNS